MFYDNFFVPRGYAVILAQALGTGFSTGCPLHGGPGDIAGMKAVIDWLQGRVQGFDAGRGRQRRHGDWDNGKAAMIGKSYDGTLANGVAATGVDGLTTIVPISAISDWYRLLAVERRPLQLGALPELPVRGDRPQLDGREPRRRAARPHGDLRGDPHAMSADDGDATGDVNPFWQARNYNDERRRREGVGLRRRTG